MQARSGRTEPLFTPVPRLTTHRGFGRTGSGCREYRHVARACEYVLLLDGLSVDDATQELRELIEDLRAEDDDDLSPAKRVWPRCPPIVQSNDELVRRTLARNVFEVTVPDPTASAIVAMLLDVQYRMHPAIGSLVGGLFYGGRLVHAAEADHIASRAPFPGRAVIVVDTVSTCTAELASEAAAHSTSIAVITPYVAQATAIRQLLAARRLSDLVECNTIHSFQGRECDVVILDLVDADPMRPSALSPMRRIS